MKSIIGVLTSIIVTPSKVFFKVLFEKSTYRAPPKRKENRATLAKTRREQLKRGMLASVGLCTLNQVDR
jgi:hypothetical protein